MSNDIHVKNGIVIPEHELEITTSRAGGPGGQHVQKSNTKVTVHWNVKKTSALTDEQKERVLQKLSVTLEGDFIIHASTSRSQQQNKKDAFDRLAHAVRQALIVPKKRMKVRVSKTEKERRLQEKARRGTVKKMRGKVSLD